MSNITRAWNEFALYLLTIFPYETWMLICKISIGVILFAGFAICFYRLRKSNMVKESIKQVLVKIEQNEKERNRAELLGKVQEEEKEEFLSKLEKSLTYSGLKKMFPWLRVEIYMTIVLCSTAVVFFGTQLITGNFIVSIIGAFVTTLIFAGIRSFLAYQNYAATENDLLNLLNLLKNYSISADEITLILLRVSKYLKNPLKSALQECYYESKTTGNNSAALLHMMDKIEHPRFKELIHSIEICGRYNADYGAILSNNRKTIQDYIAARKEQKAINKGEAYTFLILIIAAIICFAILGEIIGINIFVRLFTTSVGNLLLTYFLGIIGIFAWNVLFFDRG